MSNPNGNLFGATVEVVDGSSQDIISVTVPPSSSIQVIEDEAGATLALHGSDSAENYQTVLRSLTYQFIPENPCTHGRQDPCVNQKETVIKITDAVNSDTAIVEIQTVAPPEFYTVSGNGNVIPNGTATAPSSFYGTQLIYASPQTFVITNNGTSNLTISTIQANTAAFVATPSQSLPQTIAPSTTFDFTVTFSPTTAGIYDGTLNIVAAFSDNPTVPVNYVFNLAGNTADSFSILGTDLSVIAAGNVPNSTQGTLLVLDITTTFTVQNNAGSELEVSSITVSGPLGVTFEGVMPTYSLAQGEQEALNIFNNDTSDSNSVPGTVTVCGSYNAETLPVTFTFNIATTPNA